MGSLPNISEFCREKAHRRAVDKELDLARARARQIEFNRTDGRADNIKDRLPTLFQVRKKTVKPIPIGKYIYLRILRVSCSFRMRTFL